MGLFDFLFSSKSAGRDFIHNVNKTHVEYGTRHVAEKTSGFRLFDIHAEGAGTSGTGAGMTGIGVVGEIIIGLLVLFLLLRTAKKCAEKHVRKEGYKAYYRHHAGPNRTEGKYGPMMGRAIRQAERDREEGENNQVVELVRASSPNPATKPSSSRKFKVEV